MSHEYKQVASEGSPCLGRFCRNHAKGAPRPGPEEGLKGHPPPVSPYCFPELSCSVQFLIQGFREKGFLAAWDVAKLGVHLQTDVWGDFLA